MSFIYVGRLDELKGIKLLFEAWRLMEDNAPELKMCGTGPLENWCVEYINKYYLSAISVLGFVPNKEAKGLIANSEALILPTQWYEGFPMTILEAYSVGTPVIVSDLGNAGCVVEEGVTGYKFKPDSVDSLIEAIKLLKSSPLSNDMVRKEYKRLYCETVNYTQLKRIYDMAV